MLKRISARYQLGKAVINQTKLNDNIPWRFLYKVFKTVSLKLLLFQTGQGYGIVNKKRLLFVNKVR